MDHMQVIYRLIQALYKPWIKHGRKSKEFTSISIFSWKSSPRTRGSLGLEWTGLSIAPPPSPNISLARKRCQNFQERLRHPRILCISILASHCINRHSSASIKLENKQKHRKNSKKDPKKKRTLKNRGSFYAP